MVNIVQYYTMDYLIDIAHWIYHIIFLFFHSAKLPKSAAKAPQQQHSSQLDEQSSDSEPECLEYSMHNVVGCHYDPIIATIENNNSKLQMEVDTGASRSEDTLRHCNQAQT